MLLSKFFSYFLLKRLIFLNFLQNIEACLGEVVLVTEAGPLMQGAGVIIIIITIIIIIIMFTWCMVRWLEA